MTRVLNFGASISSGFWDPEGGWFHYLSRELHRQALEGEEDYQCYNLGVSGHNSRQILERLENEIKARNQSDHDLVVLVSCGGNDSLYEHSKDGTQVPLEEFRENLDEILETAQSYTDKVFFIGDQPVEYPVLDPLPWDLEKSVKKSEREEYMSSAEKICEKKNVAFLSISENLKEEKFLEKLVDGIHPGTEGHREIYNLVENFLKKQGVV